MPAMALQRSRRRMVAGHYKHIGIELSIDGITKSTSSMTLTFLSKSPSSPELSVLDVDKEVIVVSEVFAQGLYLALQSAACRYDLHAHQLRQPSV